MKFSESENKILLFWAIGGLIIVSIVLLINIKGSSILHINDKYEIVTANEKYGTVNNILIKFYSKINNEEKEDILKMIDGEYKTENSITTENINNFFKKYDKEITYNSRKMCYKNLTNDKLSYLVSGYVSYLYSGDKIEDKYFEVVLDKSVLHFDIKPITEEEFRGECHD